MIRSGSAPKGDNTQIGVTNSNKTISTDQIGCDGSLRVTLSLTAAPDIVANPTDIVLVLDRSGSMRGTPLADMKAGAKTFIDIIDKVTDGYQDGQIGGGSHIGIVSFADSATADTQLITSVDTLKTAVDSLVAGGNTNHKDAFVKAAGLFDPASTNAKVIVMFTDGNTTAGGPAAPAADTAKAQGMIIYCIGLVGSDGLDVNMLNLWAIDPAAAHVAVTPDSADLEELFAELAANISKTGATDIAIDEVIYPDLRSQMSQFRTKVPFPGRTIRLSAGTSLSWVFRQVKAPYLNLPSGMWLSPREQKKSISQSPTLIMKTMLYLFLTRK